MSVISKVPKNMVVTGDLHYGSVDKVVEAARVAFIRDVKPELLVDLGDFYDFWEASSYPKSIKRSRNPLSQLQYEFDEAQPYLKEVCAIVESYKYLKGNHEARGEKMADREPALASLKAMDIKRLADMPKKVEVFEHGDRLRVGPVTIEHGDRIPKGVKYPAHWMLQNKGNRNTIFGHTHKSSMATRTIYDELGNQKSYFAINQGHGQDVRKVDYVDEPDWIHGFTYVEFWKAGSEWRCTPHPIVIYQGRFSFAGKVYDGRKWM